MKFIRLLPFFLISFLVWGFFMLINLVGFLLAPILYPLAYVLRDHLRTRPFWIYPIIWLYLWLDDEDYEVPPQWWRDAKGYNWDYPSDWKIFRMVYHWNAIRNPFWNWHLLTNKWFFDHGENDMIALFYNKKPVPLCQMST